MADENRLRRRRLLKRGLLAAGLVVVLVPAAFVGFLHTESGGEALRQRIVKRLAERTTGTPTVGHLSFSLLSGISLDEVVLRQADGSEAVRVGHVLVHPALGKTIGGKPTLTALEVSGVRVFATKKDSGATTLEDLFKPAPPSKETRPGAPKEPAAYVRLARVAISDVEFTLAGPDGSRLELRKVALGGDITARPRSKGVELSLSDIAASVAVRRPDGTLLALDNLHTSLSATLVEGAGPFRLGDLTGAVVLTPAGRPSVSSPIAFGAIEGTLAPGQLSVAAKTLSALFLSVGGISVKGATKDGLLSGPQAVSITGLRIDENTLAQITGRKVLAKPLSLDVTAEGTPEALRLSGALASAGQTVSFAGSLDARVPQKLGYDLSVTTKDFALPPLLATEAPPDVKVAALELSVKGQGTKAETVAADVGLTVIGLSVRGTPVDSVKLLAHVEAGRVVVKSLDVIALGQAVHAEGSYVLADKGVLLDVRSTGSLQATLATARKLGIPLKASPILATVELPEGTHLKVEGHVGQALRVTVPNVPVRVLGATARVDAVVELGPTPDGSEKKIEAKSIDATVRLDGISPRSIARARGKTVDVSGGLSGTMRITGTPKAPIIVANLSGRLGAIGSDEVGVALTANVSGGVADAKASVKTQSGEPLLALDAHVPLPGRAPPGSRVAIVLDVPRRDLATLLPVLPPTSRLALKGVRDGFVSAHVDVKGTAQAPAGTVDVRFGGKVLSNDPREVHLTTTLTPEGSGGLAVAVAVKAESGAAGPNLELGSELRFAKSPLVDSKSPLTHHTSLRLEQDLERLPSALPLPPGLAGMVKVVADVHGSRDDLLGNVTVVGRGIRKTGSPAADLDLVLALNEADTALTGGLVLAGERLVEIVGTIGLPGKGLVPALKTKEPRSLALTVKVPDRTVASLGALAPKAKTLPGTMGGALTVSGTTAAPEGQGSFVYEGYPTATGKLGRIRFAIDAKKERAALHILPGDLGEIAVSLPLGDFLAARKGDLAADIPAELTTRLSGDLASALPRVGADRDVRLWGGIESDLGAALMLAVSKGGVAVGSVKMTGKLAVSGGKVELPAKHRVLRDIGLVLAAAPEGLALEQLAVHESDGEKADRSIQGSGSIPFATTGGRVGLGPISADLVAKDFLVSGGNFGEHDAPRASLSGALGVRADLSGDTQRFEVDARDLVVFSPDRQPRAHVQEVLSKGDVASLKDAPVGLLAQPASRAAEKAEVAGDAKTDGAKGSEKGLEIRVHVRGTRLFQAPIDLQVEGDVVVERAPGQERTVGGALRVTGGRMLFGGRWLEVERGEIRMTDKGPVLDVRFQKEAPVWALRDLATEGQGHDRYVRIHLAGVMGKQEAKPVGLGDSLFEALAVLNLGQVRTITRPDLQASSSPQLPEIREIRQTSFMAANLPHLAFMDRAGVRSDPADGRFSYGRLTRLEGERYLDGGKRRIRVTTRPLEPGKSEGEVAHEWLFQNDKQVVSGAGVQAGTRLGGGPTLFWEWSSKE